jgi:hypothetical protein
VDLFKFFDHYVPSLSPRFAPHVLEIMAELNPRKSLKQLRKHAVDRAAVNRATSLELLGRLGDTRSAGLVAGGLIDHDATVRLAATEAAARLELREASPLLISNLNDADLRVQYASQDALALLWPHSEEEESPYKAGEWVRFWKEEAARKVARAYYPDDVAPLVKPGTEWEDE